MNITFNNKVSETEKAICVSITIVNPFSDKVYEKKQWMPKSAVESITDTTATIKDWFGGKMIAEQLEFMHVQRALASVVFKYVINYSK